MGALRGVSAGVRGSRQVSSVTWPIYVILVFRVFLPPSQLRALLSFFLLFSHPPSLLLAVLLFLTRPRANFVTLLL